MGNKIILAEKEKEAVIAFHEKNAESIKIKISELKKELEQTHIRIAELTGISVLDIGSIVDGLRLGVDNNTFAAQGKYSKAFPLWKKAEYILLLKNRIATTRQIAEMIIEQESGLLKPNLISDLVSALGATLLPKVKGGEVFNRIVLKDEFYYGLCDWWNGDGELDDLFL